MKQVVVLHDAFANPLSYWYQKVQSIIPVGYTFLSPEFSDGTEQGMAFWMKTLESIRQTITSDTIIITHGISTLAWLRFLETLSTPVRMTIIVAGCDQVPGHQAIVPIAKTFLHEPFQYELIKKNIGTAIVISNAIDPFIAPVLSKDLSDHISGQEINLSGTGHFNQQNEPELMQAIQKIFQEITTFDQEQVKQKELYRAQAQKEELAKSLVPGVITYDSTKAQSLSGYSGSVIAELLADARQQEELKKIENPASTKNVLFIFGAIIFLLIGIGLVGYAFVQLQPKIAPLISQQKTTYINSIMQADSFETLSLDDVPPFELLKNFTALQQKEIPTKTFSAIIPISNQQPVLLQKFFESLNITTPLGFTAKAKDYLYGFYQPENGEKIPFLVVRFDGYDTMNFILKDWEPRMIVETRTLFQKLPVELVTQPEPQPFIDVIEKNIPLWFSVLFTGEQIYYGFVTDTVLLMTPNAEVIEPLVRSLRSR